MASKQLDADKKSVLERALNSPTQQRRDVARVRASLVQLARGNVDKVQEWLDKVANGIAVEIPVLDADGNETGKMRTHYVNDPDPARALDLFFKMLKFSVPELRAVAVDMNVSGDAQPRKLSLAQIEQMLAEEAAIDGEVVEE